MTVPVLLLAALLSADPAPAPRPFAQRALIPFTVGAVMLAGGGVFLGVSVVQTNEAALLAGEDRDKRLDTATNNRVGAVMLLTSGALVRIWGPIALGGDVVLAVRRAKFDDDLFDRSVTGATARITLNWVSNESLGAVLR